MRRLLRLYDPILGSLVIGWTLGVVAAGSFADGSWVGWVATAAMCLVIVARVAALR